MRTAYNPLRWFPLAILAVMFTWPQFTFAQAPVLTSITPTSGVVGTAVPVTLVGSNLTVATINPIPGITITNTVATATQVTATFTIAGGATTGLQNVTVTTAGGTSNAVNFTINPPPPALTSIAPTSGVVGTAVPVTLAGSNLSLATINPIPGITITNTVATATQVTATFTIAGGATTGLQNVTVTTAGGTSNAVNFTINPPPPALTSITPASGVVGTSIPVTLTGSNLSLATINPIPGITITNTVATATQVTATFTIAGGATTGLQNVTVTTAGGTSNAVNFTINPPPPALTSVTPASGVVGTSVPVTLAGSNLTLATINPIPGITITNTVATATQVTATFTIAGGAAAGPRNVTVTTAGGTSTPITFTVYPPLGVPLCTPSGTGPFDLNTAYSIACSVSGGSGTYSWSFAPASITLGLTINSSTGAVSSPFTSTGSFSFRIQVQDTILLIATATSTTFTGTVNPLPTVTCDTSSLPLALRGPTEVSVPYTSRCTVSGGTPTFSWTISPSPAALPAGLFFVSAGNAAIVFGTPTTAPQTYTYTVGVVDQYSQAASAPAFSSSIVPAPTLTCGTTGSQEVNVFQSTTCTVTDGTAPYTWTPPVLPNGLNFNSSGANATISGSPTAGGNFSYVVTVEDSATSVNGAQSTPYHVARSQQFNGVIKNAPTISCTGSPQKQQFTAYNDICTVNGGTSPFSWSQTGQLPSGVNLSVPNPQDTSIAIISGFPTAAGLYNYTLQVVDSASTPQLVPKPFSVTITAGVSINCSVVDSAPTHTLPSIGLEVNVPFDTGCDVAGGTPDANGNFKWVVTGLPSGVNPPPTNSGRNVHIAGTPTGAGPYTIFVSVTDSNNAVVNRQITVNIAPLPSITCGAGGPTQVGVLYSNTCTVTGGTGPLSWSTTISIPGLGLSAPTGSSVTITGTPTVPTPSYSFSVTATDVYVQAASQSFQGAIRDRVQISCTPLAGPVEVGVPYNAGCSVAGGIAPFSWTLQGRVPAGIAISPVSGLFTSVAGSPLVDGSFDYSVVVTDSSTFPGQSASQRFTGSVAKQPSIVCDSTAGPAEAGIPYFITCQAIDGSAPYTWSVNGDSLGLTLGATQGTSITLSGTPTATGAYSYSLQVTDSNQGKGLAKFSGTIHPVLTTSLTHSGDLSLQGSGGVLKAVITRVSGSEIDTSKVSAIVTLPDGLSLKSIDNSAGGWNCTSTGQTVTCERMDQFGVPEGSAFPPIILNIRVLDQACLGELVSQAAVRLDGSSQGIATDTLNAPGCLQITKTHSGSFPSGGAGKYTLTVQNISGVTVSGNTVVTDTLHPSLSVAPGSIQAIANGWTCSAAQSANNLPWTVTCARSDALQPGQFHAAIEFPVSVASTGCFAIDDAVVLVNGKEQGRTRDATSIAGGPGCLTLQGTFTSTSDAPPTPVAGIYTLTISNTGQGAVTDPIQVALTLPAGLTAVSSGGDASWQCDLTSTPVGCARSRLEPSQIAPLTITVSGSLACGVSSGQATISLNGAPQGQATVIPTSIPGPACMSIILTGPKILLARDTGTYTLKVSNPDTSSKTGVQVDVHTTLPAGLQPISASGSASNSPWSCIILGQNIDCHRADDLAGSASYDDITVQLTSSLAACPAFTTMFSLSVNGTPNAAASASTPMQGCMLISKTHVGDFPLGGTGLYRLTTTYLGDSAPTGAIKVTDILPTGLTPQAFVAPDGGALDPNEWNCGGDSANPQKIVCTRPAAGNYTPIGVLVNVGVNACPSASSSAEVLLNGITEAFSGADQTNISGACPGGALTLTTSPLTLFVPGRPGRYALTVTNSSDVATTDPVVLSDAFPLGLLPDSYTGDGWSCTLSLQSIKCNRTETDSLQPQASYPPIVVSLLVDQRACPSGQDSLQLTLGGKNMPVPSGSESAINLQGCLNVSGYTTTSSAGRPMLSFAATTLETSQSLPLTFTSGNATPMTVTIQPLPANSAYSLSFASTAVGCASPNAGKSCILNRGDSISVNVQFLPVCIGSDKANTDTLTYSIEEVGATNTIDLTGVGKFRSISFLQAPGGQLLQSSIAPLTQLNLGLATSPANACTGPAGPYSAKIQYEKFVRSGNAQSNPGQTITYDQGNASCPSGTAGCLGAIQTGTVAGDVYLNVKFFNSSNNEVAYPGGPPNTSITVPELKPFLSNVAKGTVSSSSLQLDVTGYSTPRQATQACFAFKAAPGAVLNTDGLNKCFAKDAIDVLYSLNSSVKTGSQFTTAVTFSFAGNSSAIGTIDVWLNNEPGDSNHLCMDFKSGTTQPGACP